jgi:hypothetical protein
MTNFFEPQIAAVNVTVNLKTDQHGQVSKLHGSWASNNFYGKS